MEAFLETAPYPIRLVDRLSRAPAVRAAMLVGLDAIVASGALWFAFFLRFEGHVPGDYAAIALALTPGFAAIRVALASAFGLHRWSFRMSGLSEAIRLISVVFAGSVAIATFQMVAGPALLPRSVIALEFFLTVLGMGACRFAPRVLANWYFERRRVNSADGRRAIIIGAGSAGELLLRDLLRSPSNPFRVVAFLDDDRTKHGTHIGGRAVAGSIGDLPRVATRLAATDVLIAIPRLSSDRIREILRLCSSLQLSFKIIPASFVVLDQKVSAAMLHDLTPEDLLPRDQVKFDRREVAAKIAGKRVLITGASGSIGSEIARQVASHGPSELVLVDINENDLYFLERRLQELHPALKLYARIADIRDERRIQAMGLQFRPHYVFHAAAHKHVPLMEDAPDEAVKNNVFGTLNVARMADACGADRFVLISTDKAVRPSSVMGATKRVAELVVRDLASRSKTAFTAVRFGNVLGSAGSVVPLFKQQIARGGPVTVTDPECTRYFMTIPEAVGLVLLAGLGGYGELCVLDMGEPIKIAELASNLITMAGLVPGKDVEIVFTGLRPGEKLSETLLSEEEESMSQVRDRIMVAKSPPPPPQFADTLAQLRAIADDGNAESVRAHLRSIVPTFVSPQDAQRGASRAA